jgi:two-component system chemotaxis response regulator CheB
VDRAPIRVLVVDDSAIVRKVLAGIVSAEPDMQVVGSAPDPYVARDKILALKPDVLTLDIEMPRMDGLTFLDRIMRFHPMPVIVISSLSAPSARIGIEALHRGAVDVLAKPGGPYSVEDLRADLPARIRAAARARLRTADKTPEAKPSSTHASRSSVIAIGASTGGTQAIETVLQRLPRDMPPIVIAQHIPPNFSAAFAARLDKVCAITVREAGESETLTPGLVLVAPGGKHLVVERAGTDTAGRPRWRTRLDQGPKVHYQRPSVDVLFHSLRMAAGGEAVAALLTGMGEDGADGLHALRGAGAFTVAQDEASCVVFGMPKAAIERDAACRVAPLTSIASLLYERTRVAQRTDASSRALSENG